MLIPLDAGDRLENWLLQLDFTPRYTSSSSRIFDLVAIIFNRLLVRQPYPEDEEPRLSQASRAAGRRAAFIMCTRRRGIAVQLAAGKGSPTCESR